MVEQTKINKTLPMSEREKSDNANAVRMIILVACLDYAMVDVQFELENAGIFRQQVKRDFNLANKHVMYAHSRFFSMLYVKNFKEASKQYLKYADDTWENINCAFSLSGLEGAVNKAISLCRLAMKYNDDLKGKYDCWFMYKLASVVKFLSSLGVKDYNLDFLTGKQLAY